MKKLLFLLLISFSTYASDLIIELGQSLKIPLSSNRIWVEKSSLLKVDATSGQISLTGKKKGESLIRIGSKTQTVQIVDINQIELLNFLKKRTQQIPGLSTKIVNGEIEVHGYLHSWKIWKDILKDQSFKSSYIMKAKLSDDLKRNLQSHIDEDLKALGLLNINVNQDPQLHIRLNPSQQGLDLYEQYFQKLGIPLALLKESLAMEPIIRVDITVMELSKSSALNLSIELPEKMHFSVLPSTTLENLPAIVKALESNGNARTLARPNLICRSGKEAEFFAGGEFPIKIINYKMQDIIWKKYGVMLKIKPLADSSGKISLSIETEVSSLAEPVEGIPAIQTNKVSSHFDLSQSQVIALSGLLREENIDGKKGLPFLSRLPVLGSLFSSQNYLNKKTELIILVKPSLMNVGSSHPLEAKNGHR